MAAFTSAELQKAIFSTVGANAGVKTLIGTPARLFDTVPPSSVEFPYVTLGHETAGDWSTKTFDGQDATFQLDAWSRDKRGKLEAKQILGALHAALHRATFAITGSNLVFCRYEFSEVLRDPDGQTHHGVIRFRVVTHA